MPEEDLTALVAKTLDVAATQDVAIEISSAGLRKPVGEIYPARAIVLQMRARNIPISFSSDAHAPSEIGADYDKIIDLARSEGYDQLATFEHRTRRMVSIG